MTVRRAEFVTAFVMILASLALMYKSTDGLSIGWVRGSGPGSGAWPFWLSTVMLLSSIAIMVRARWGLTPQSRSEDLFMGRIAVRIVGTTVLALTLLLIGTHYIGLYFSLFAFLFFYLKVLGGHSFTTSIGLTILIPVVVFFFFEYLLIIPLPKGLSEPLFYPIYELIY